LAQSNGSGSVRVEIYDQTYQLRGSDPEYIGKLADYVDTKMRIISQQASTVDSLRVAVLAALNIADEYLILKRKYEAIDSDYHHRAEQLSGALDEVLEEVRRVG
jgi:cell division protein ZapA